MTNPRSNSTALKWSAGVAFVFGILTIFSGGSVLFGGEETRTAMGNTVPFVLWFNFLAGFVYVITAISLFLRTRLALWLSISILIATFLVALAFSAYIFNAGAYEIRTIGAMTLRTVIWAIISSVAWQHLGVVTNERK